MHIASGLAFFLPITIPLVAFRAGSPDYSQLKLTGHKSLLIHPQAAFFGTEIAACLRKLLDFTPFLRKLLSKGCGTNLRPGRRPSQ